MFPDHNYFQLVQALHFHKIFLGRFSHARLFWSLASLDDLVSSSDCFYLRMQTAPFSQILLLWNHQETTLPISLVSLDFLHTFALILATPFFIFSIPYCVEDFLGQQIFLQNLEYFKLLDMLQDKSQAKLNRQSQKKSASPLERQ